MPAIWPPERPLEAKFWGLLGLLGAPATVAEGLLVKALLRVADDVGREEAGLVVMLELPVGTVDVGEVVGAAVGLAVSVVGGEVAVAVGAVEGADSAVTDPSCVPAAVPPAVAAVSVGAAGVVAAGVGAAVCVAPPPSALPPLLSPSVAVAVGATPLLSVAVGVAEGSACPGVVYSVPKSGAGNGPVYSKGTFTTEYVTLVVTP